MARPKSKYPTELELEILKILWERCPLPVREVRAVLNDRGRPLAHTSLITTLNVMVDKGYASRREAGRGYEFFPEVSRNEVSRGMIGDLIERVFEGSSKALVLSVLGNEKLDPAERQELRAVIEAEAQQAGDMDR